MKTIINLTQHAATPEQRAAGVMDLNTARRKQLQGLLTFDELPTHTDVHNVATTIATFMHEWYPNETTAMIGGAPYLMRNLEFALSLKGIHAVYAFSKRDIVEKRMPDGSVVKTDIFKHLGFVETRP